MDADGQTLKANAPKIAPNYLAAAVRTPPEATWAARGGGAHVGRFSN